MKSLFCRAPVNAPKSICGRRISVRRDALNRRDVLIGGGGAATLTLPQLSCPSIYDFSLEMMGNPVSLKKYEGQNVNYPGLRALYDKYKTMGFNLLAVPCNQFGGQAPGTSEEERAWAFRKFGFEFDVYDKIDVNGPNAHPLYKYLKQAQPISAPGTLPSRPNGDIEWNYTKFVIDRNGQAVKRLKPSFDPLQAESDIRLILAGKPPLPAECIMHPGKSVCNVEKLLQA